MDNNIDKRIIRTMKDGWGMECYYEQDVLHREDGPAIRWITQSVNLICDDFGKEVVEKETRKEWWLNGENLTEEKFDLWLLAKKLEAELPVNVGVQNNKIKV